MTQRAAEERAVIVADWPQPAVVAESRMRAEGSSRLLRYRTADDKIVVACFPLSTSVVFGAPNDEALGGHPLFRLGLKYYSVHEIVNSSLVEMLERRNSIHPRHDHESFLRDK